MERAALHTYIGATAEITTVPRGALLAGEGSMATPVRASYRPPSPLELERKSRPARRAALGQSGVVPKPREMPRVSIPKPPPVPAPIALVTKAKPVAAIPLSRARKPRLAVAPPPPAAAPMKPSVVVLGCIWLLG